MNIRLMKTLDAVFGRIAVSLLPAPAVRHVSVGIRSILVIRPGGIGDAVLLIPALQALRGKFPEAKLTVLAERRNCAVFGLCPDVDRVLLYDRLSDLLQAVRGSYDATIDSEQWHRLSAVIARMTRSALLIGYATNQRSRLFSHPIRYSHDDYEAVSFFNLLEPLEVQGRVMSERFLNPPEASVAVAAHLLADLGDTPFVTIFPGASIPERRWGADRFHKVAEMLSAFDLKVVVVGGKDDHQQGEAIIAGGSGVNLAGRTTLVETAAVIDRSALLLSGDSGLLHIAVGLGKPTVSLFGAGRADKWAPCGDRHIVINRHLPCSPCTTYGTTPRCSHNAQCMRDITVEEVANAVMMLFGQRVPCLQNLC